jgi:hypothetical protein
MSLILNGDGSIQSLVVGGLPTGTVNQATLATPVAGTGPAFSAYMSGSDQSITAGSVTKVRLDATNFDTNSNFNTSTYRFTPTVAGYYQFNGNIFQNATGVRASTIAGYIYKNGSNAAVGQLDIATPNSIVGSSQVNRIIFMNGTTDYVELYGIQVSGTGNIFSAGSANTYMTGTLVRAT